MKSILSVFDNYNTFFNLINITLNYLSFDKLSYLLNIFNQTLKLSKGYFQIILSENYLI